MTLFHRVERDDEFERIFALPTRVHLDPEALARAITLRFRRVPTPWPLRAEDASIFPHQALAIREAAKRRGLLGLLPVGSGKTLISALVMSMLRAERPLLLVPASMLTDTKQTWEKLARDWHVPNPVVLSYEKLSSPRGALALKHYEPDLIVADECHKLGNISAAATRRVGRYLLEHEGTMFVGLTGTLIRSSLRQGAHIADWALGENSPLPRTWATLEAWCGATDARGAFVSPGVLLDKLNPEETLAYNLADSVEDARGIVCGMLGRRIQATPGVVTNGGGPLSIPARLRAVLPESEDPEIEHELRLVLEGGEGREPGSLPDGTILPDAAALSRPKLTLPLGFWLQADPRPSEEYRAAASAWARAVRGAIKYRGFDSEYMVRTAVEKDELPEGFRHALRDWKHEQREYEKRTGLPEPACVPRWISDEAIRAVERWLERGPGVVWVSFVGLGERLERDLEVPYFAGGKRDSSGRHVTELLRGESAVLSHASVGVGTDGLQFCHHRQLYLCAPTEQSLGRLHRQGQEADRVECDIYIPGAEALRRYWRAVQVATQFAGQLARREEKLSYFENLVPHKIERKGQRWRGDIP